jgi:hypothetical protein
VFDVANGALNVTCEVKRKFTPAVPLGAAVDTTVESKDLYGVLHVAEDTIRYGSLSPSELTCITHGRNSDSYHPSVFKEKM